MFRKKPLAAEGGCEKEAGGQRPGRKRRFAIKIITWGAVVRLCVLAVIIGIFCLWGYFTMIKMPGKSYMGELAALTDEQKQLRDELVRDVEKLAGEIGERNIWNWRALADAADFIEASLSGAGYKVRRQECKARGKSCFNIEVETTGDIEGEQIIIVGAHYDSVYGSPGANDNASAVAATLALARRFEGSKSARTIRFVFFVNEEPPFYHTEQMGSYIYAESCRAKGENIIAMISLETIGYYSDRPNSQKYPFPFGLVYPSTGNFIGFVSNFASRGLLHQMIGSFRRSCKFPSEGGAIPQIVPGISWSDHWSFWKCGYPAIMVTDTALFRYPYYHTAEDSPDKIDYECLARVVSGLQSVIAEIVGFVEQ